MGTTISIRNQVTTMSICIIIILGSALGPITSIVIGSLPDNGARHSFYLVKLDLTRSENGGSLLVCSYHCFTSRYALPS